MGVIWKKKLANLWPWIVFCIVALILAAFFKMLTLHHPRAISAFGLCPSSAHKAKTHLVKPHAITIDIGGEYVINDNTIACVNDQTCQELKEILSARDAKGLKEFLSYEKGFSLSGGDNVLVLDTNFWREEAKVRVLDGPHLGITGWVPKKNLSAK